MLKFSTRGRYAVRIMTYLALHSGDALPARKKLVATSENISANYVEQILIRLKARGLVQSFRGRGSGGFLLGRPAEDITVADVLEATEGPMALAPCTASACRRSSRCAARGLWCKAQAALTDVFRHTTIAELAAEARHLEATRAPNFQI